MVIVHSVHIHYTHYAQDSQRPKHRGLTNSHDSIKIFVSNSSPAPIYEQIARQIKEQIVNGQLTEGYALPSIRKLAKDLQVSVITTKRAYEELEKASFIHAVRGKGCFVAAQNLELLREMKMRVVEP